MANLSEIEQYDAGIYQIEPTDPVLGGADGITNVPLKGLANRTKWLKRHIDDLEAGVTVPAGVATQTYLQAELNKLAYKPPVLVATTTNITLSGTQTIDGIALVVGDRVLVKNQSTASQNGIYVVASGAWTRAADLDADTELRAGIVVVVTNGSTNADSLWLLATDGVLTIGVSALTFTNLLDTTVRKDSPTGAAAVPTGSTAQRPANGAGKFRFNTDLGRFEGNNGTAWGSLGGATGGGTDAVFYLNDQTVNNDYTVPGAQNAMSAGPITIANGKTVTVADGAVWTIV